MTKPIIIADDDAELRRTFVRYIRKFSGREVHEVEDGKDLVDKVREGDYCLVFTDNNMDYMNGLIAIRMIRKFNQSIPICMVSASDSPSDMEAEARKTGATDYIDKTDYANLTERLESVIEKYLGGN